MARSEFSPVLKLEEKMREWELAEPATAGSYYVAAAGSLDPKLRFEALRQISANDYEPKEESEEQRVDIEEQFSQFSEEEIELISKNIMAVQFTEGCNGFCPFCFLATKGQKRGVTAHYSFPSLRKSFERFRLEKAFPYWASDPFDYYDKDELGEYTFLDIYKLYGLRPVFVSTSIPRGSERRFIDFVKAIVEDILSATHDANFEEGDYFGPKVRISVGKHNIRRVINTLRQLFLELESQNYSRNDIEDLFAHGIILADRVNVRSLGPLIEKHNDIADAEAFGRYDGVVVTPKSISGRITVAPTVYEPTGEISIKLQPGRVKNLVPRCEDLEVYRMRVYDMINYSIVLGGRVLVDFPHLPDGSYLELPNEEENCILILGRAAHSLAQFFSTLSEGEKARIKPSYEGGRKNLMRQVEIDFRGIKERTSQAMEKANALAEEADEETRRRLQFYILLAAVHLKEMQFLLNEYKKGASLSELIKIAKTFRGMGKNEFAQLDAKLDELHKEINSGKRRWLFFKR
jgi:hypothetical protein